MHRLIIIVLLVICFNAEGQKNYDSIYTSPIDVPLNTITKDTFRISEVKITQTRTQLFSEANKKEVIDTFLLKFYENNNLSYLIRNTSLSSITSYGSYGAVSSARIRGGGSTHTQVSWNNIPINSLTTGSADLSMIPVGAFNQINVIYGASGSMFGSGTSGGAIELNNTPHFSNNKSFNLHNEIGSFSNYRSNLSAQISTNKISYSGQAFYGYGKNDFPYTDVLDFGSPKEKAINAENTEYGTTHSLFLNLKNHTLRAGLWYQAKDHNVPGTMGIGDPVSYQNQKDSTLKTFIGWRWMKEKYQVNAQTAFIHDGLLYTNKSSEDGDYTIYSEIASRRWLNLISSRYYLHSDLIFSGQVKYDYLIGDVSSYGEMIYEKEGEFSLAIKYSPKRFLINASVSKNWNSATSPPIMYSFSGLYNIYPNTFSLRGKVASNYKRPTFNDRYWQPGGNPDLNPEQGKNYEVGSKLNLSISNHQNITLDINYYHSTNENLIIWVPVGSISQAENVDNVLSQGIEFDGLYNLHLSKIDLSIHLAYSYSNSQYNNPDNDNYKETLTYHPKQIGRNNIIAYYKRWSVGINNSFQSSMSSTDGKLLDSVFLTDMLISYDYALNHIKGKIKFTTNNVLNSSYQLVYAYPMPGRSYWFGISLNI